MPDPEKMVRLLDRAVGICRKTSGRVGRLVSLNGAADILVAGDLHGNVGHFQSLFQKADLVNHARRHLVFQEVIHGPFLYDDGSDKSHQLLDLVAAAMTQFPGRVHFLPGNHEFAQRTGRPVARVGGEMNSLFRNGVAQAYGQRADEIYDLYMTLIDAAPLAIRTPNRIAISHSLPPLGKMWNPDVLTAAALSKEEFEPGGSVYHLVWGRDTSEAAATAYLQSIDADWLICGHIPCPDGFAVPNPRQLILDSQQPPAAYCLIRAAEPITHDELIQSVWTI